jgi:hypothetical protein
VGGGFDGKNGGKTGKKGMMWRGKSDVKGM